MGQGQSEAALGAGCPLPRTLWSPLVPALTLSRSSVLFWERNSVRSGVLKVHAFKEGSRFCPVSLSKVCAIVHHLPEDVNTNNAGPS